MEVKDSKKNKASEVSIVIPTYNEKGNLDALINRIHKACKEWDIQEEIIIVDDNSPDGTADFAIKMGKKFPISVIRRSGKLGLSSAVMEGFGASKSKIWGVIDADLSHPPEVIPHLVSLVKDKGNDIAIGSRYVKGGGVEQWTLTRKIVSRGATLLALFLTRAKDPMSGFFFFDRKIMKGAKLKPKGYKILLEILVKARYKTLAEYPYVFQNREVGSSKLGSKTILHYISQLFSLYGYRISRIIRRL